MLSSGVLPTRQYTPTKLGPQVLPGGGFLLQETLGLVQQQGLLSWSKQPLPPPQGEARQGDANMQTAQSRNEEVLSAPLALSLPRELDPAQDTSPGSQQLQSACFKSHLTPH